MGAGLHQPAEGGRARLPAPLLVDLRQHLVDEPELLLLHRPQAPKVGQARELDEEARLPGRPAGAELRGPRKARHPGAEALGREHRPLEPGLVPGRPPCLQLLGGLGAVGRRLGQRAVDGAEVDADPGDLGVEERLEGRAAVVEGAAERAPGHLGGAGLPDHRADEHEQHERDDEAADPCEHRVRVVGELLAGHHHLEVAELRQHVPEVHVRVLLRVEDQVERKRHPDEQHGQHDRLLLCAAAAEEGVDELAADGAHDHPLDAGKILKQLRPRPALVEHHADHVGDVDGEGRDQPPRAVVADDLGDHDQHEEAQHPPQVLRVVEHLAVERAPRTLEDALHRGQRALAAGVGGEVLGHVGGALGEGGELEAADRHPHRTLVQRAALRAGPPAPCRLQGLPGRLHPTDGLVHGLAVLLAHRAAIDGLGDHRQEARRGGGALLQGPAHRQREVPRRRVLQPRRDLEAGEHGARELVVGPLHVGEAARDGAVAPLPPAVEVHLPPGLGQQPLQRRELPVHLTEAAQHEAHADEGVLVLEAVLEPLPGAPEPRQDVLGRVPRLPDRHEGVGQESGEERQDAPEEHADVVLQHRAQRLALPARLQVVHPRPHEEGDDPEGDVGIEVQPERDKDEDCALEPDRTCRKREAGSVDLDVHAQVVQEEMYGVVVQREDREADDVLAEEVERAPHALPNREDKVHSAVLGDPKVLDHPVDAVADWKITDRQHQRRHKDHAHDRTANGQLGVRNEGGGRPPKARTPRVDAGPLRPDALLPGSAQQAQAGLLQVIVLAAL
mmetsp:Transcript_109225/g.348509  ORF Transcript_109225/g.348509 Transcript_109225/m.348509 type:complete len:787 (+) Transcript_109225:266-2626(+)